MTLNEFVWFQVIPDVVKFFLAVYFGIGGVITVGAAVSFIFDKDEASATMAELWAEATTKEKFQMIGIFLFYGVICWLPIATGRMKTPVNWGNND